MPIAIHAREADQEVMDILKEEGAFSGERKLVPEASRSGEGYVTGRPGALSSDGSAGCGAGTGSGENTGSTVSMCDDARVLLHCFSGSAELGKQYVRMGATISVAGPVTYKNNRKTVAMVSEIPLSFLLVETDSPYLTPAPFRGRPNMPPYVEHTAAKIADKRDILRDRCRTDETERDAFLRDKEKNAIPAGPPAGIPRTLMQQRASLNRCRLVC